MRILLDHNVPVGVRSFLKAHKVSTIVELKWPPQIENGELIRAAETANFNLLITSDQNIRYQQNLKNTKIALLVLGSNIWPVVRRYGSEIGAKVNLAAPGSYAFIEMPVESRAEHEERSSES